MKILIGCEKSGVIRRAFRARGHDAFSCDLEPSYDNSAFHIQEDVLIVMEREQWDLGIFHPTCTRLANSGVLRLYHGASKRGGFDPAKWKEMEEAATFFRRFLDTKIKKVCVENPIQHRHANLPKWNQKIQPYDFGEDASKATCLWLKNLPPLKPTKYFKPRMVCECGTVYSYDDHFKAGCPRCYEPLGKPRWSNQTDSGQNKLAPSARRAAIRADTYPGIAEAMAEQWGSL